MRKPVLVLVILAMLSAVSAITFSIQFSNGWFAYRTTDFNAVVSAKANTSNWYYWTGSDWNTTPGRAQTWLDSNSNGTAFIRVTAINSPDCNWAFIIGGQTLIGSEAKYPMYASDFNVGKAIGIDDNIYIAINPKTQNIGSCAVTIADDYNIVGS